MSDELKDFLEKNEGIDDEFGFFAGYLFTSTPIINSDDEPQSGVPDTDETEASDT
jgi:hypothetical protein